MILVSQVSFELCRNVDHDQMSNYRVGNMEIIGENNFYSRSNEHALKRELFGASVRDAISIIYPSLSRDSVNNGLGVSSSRSSRSEFTRIII